MGRASPRSISYVARRRLSEHATCSNSTARICAIERRKGEPKILLKRARFGLALNDCLAGDGPALFDAGLRHGLEGIVSKRRSSPYRSGRSPYWLKAKKS